eukprot:5500903-Amphidinium_carterae.1
MIPCQRHLSSTVMAVVAMGSKMLHPIAQKIALGIVLKAYMRGRELSHLLYKISRCETGATDEHNGTTLTCTENSTHVCGLLVTALACQGDLVEKLASAWQDHISQCDRQAGIAVVLFIVPCAVWTTSVSQQDLPSGRRVFKQPLR